MSGKKIIDGLQQALDGGFKRVTMGGVTWVHDEDLQKDLKETMKINNKLRNLLLDGLQLPDASIKIQNWKKRVRNHVK